MPTWPCRPWPRGSAPPVAAPAPTTVAGTSATTVHEHDEGGEEAAASASGGGEGKANLAIGLSVLAIVAAIGAFLAGRRSGAATPAAPKPGAGGGQDW